MILSLVLLLLLISLACLVNGYKNYKEYMASDYYKMTQFPYQEMLADTGKCGEYDIYRCLKSLKGYKRYLFNCYIPKEDEMTTEVDVILLHESGIYVFESKNYSGWIFGTETQKQWTQSLSSGKGKTIKEHFLNPIIQNKVHLKWLQIYLKNFDSLKFYSYIVFSKRCELKNITLTSNIHHVIKRDNLLKEISENISKVGSCMTPSLVDEIYDRLYPLTQIDEKQKKEHIVNIKERYEKSVTAAKIQDKKCPRCGGKLVLRTAGKGTFEGNKFYGCVNYPKCRYIEKV